MYNESIFIEDSLPSILSVEELYEYLKEARAGSSIAREKVIEHNIKLVLYRVTKVFSNVPYEKCDLVSVGIIGLIKAVDNFDIEKNFKFSTFASRCIENEILMFIRKMSKHQSNNSLYKSIITDCEGNEILLESVLASDEKGVETTILDKELQIELRQQIELLDDQDKEIIKLYYGFYNSKRHTQREIGCILGVSQALISNRISKIVNIIGKSFLEKKLIDKVNKKRKIKTINKC